MSLSYQSKLKTFSNLIEIVSKSLSTTSNSPVTVLYPSAFNVYVYFPGTRLYLFGVALSIVLFELSFTSTL
ncbi:MAG: hypothetical protein V8S33_00765 [Intestinibacter bartlettii]